MKVQCDVCGKEEASLFCSADEAALCDACDRRVHLANKLAGNHSRFSLLPSNNSPICDICKEKRGLLFCHQDRSVLCKDCDVPIHKTNEHTQKHNRFLLTGVKLKPLGFSSLSSSSVPSIHVVPHLVPSANSSLVNKSVNSALTPRVAEIPSSSTISEYLIETLPGWHVEDFLDSSSTSPPTFIKTGECDLTSFWDADLDENFSCKENMGILVPHAPTPLQTFSSNQYMNMDMHKITKGKMELNENSRKRTNTNACFNDPHIIPPSTTTITKKSRTSWY